MKTSSQDSRIYHFLGPDKYANPFAFDEEDHPLDSFLWLHCTSQAFKKYVAPRNTPGTITGNYIRSILRQCLIRRTFQSKIPFDGGRIIGQDIPPSHATLLKTTFNLDEQHRYNELYASHIKRLIRKLETGKLIWDMGYFRKLVLFTKWLGFEYCKPMMASNATSDSFKPPISFIYCSPLFTAHYSQSSIQPVPLFQRLCYGDIGGYSTRSTQIACTP